MGTGKDGGSVKTASSVIGNLKLVDNATGKKYKLRKLQGLPMKDLFFIYGVAGDIFAMMLEFE